MTYCHTSKQVRRSLAGYVNIALQKACYRERVTHHNGARTRLLWLPMLSSLAALAISIQTSFRPHELCSPLRQVLWCHSSQGAPASGCRSPASRAAPAPRACSCMAPAAAAHTQREAQQRDREAIDEQYGGHIRARQQLEEGSKAVGEQEHAYGCQDGAEGHLRRQGRRCGAR